MRISQLRASLERMRWVFRDLPDDYLVVDIAGYHAYLFKDGEKIWSIRVQVGKPYRATPVFKDTLRYLDFNPTWTIPPGILRNETLPAIRRDPSYLGRNNMSVVTTAGAIVDPSTIDWAATASKGFPYMIRQEPGPHNALGRIKFGIVYFRKDVSNRDAPIIHGLDEPFRLSRPEGVEDVVQRRPVF
jgi:murein L,D-transpeptidase YcbB/YkuD